MAELISSTTAYIQTDMIFGLAWYIWGFVACGVVIMALLGVFAWYYFTMAPVNSYFWSAWANEDVGIFLRLSGRMSLRPLKYLTGIFNDKRYPLSWIQRGDSTFRLGKCSAKIITDMTGIATEPELNMAIKTWVAEHNDAELKKQADAYFNGDTYAPRMVLDYYDLYEMVKNGEVDDPVVIPAVYEVPLWEIQRYLAHIGSGDLEGHIATRIEEDKEEERDADKKMPGWMWLFIAVEVIILIPIALIMLM